MAIRRILFINLPAHVLGQLNGTSRLATFDGSH